MAVAAAAVGLFVARRPCVGLHVVARLRRRIVSASWSSSSCVSSAALAADAIPTPLAERPARHNCSLKELRRWRAEARERVSHVDFSADHGPTAADLQREVDWLLDDAVAAVRTGGGAAWSEANWKQASLLQREDDKVETDVEVALRATVADITALLDRRVIHREPFQYIIQAAHWRDLVLAVAPGVLIPRPETEILIDLVEEACNAFPELKSGVWVDMGTGSGALAVALARTLPEASTRVYATDVSHVAAAIALCNVRRYKLADRVSVHMGSWFTALPADLIGTISGIVSNPPYIPREHLPTLQAEVRLHEPHLALDGGSVAGSYALDIICKGARQYLRPGGFVGLETNGGDQATHIAELLRRLQFTSVKVVDDCYGVARFVVGYNGVGGM